MVCVFRVFWSVVPCFLRRGGYAETGRDVMDRVYKQADIFPNSEAEVRLVVKNKRGGERERFFICVPKMTQPPKKSGEVFQTGQCQRRGSGFRNRVGVARL